MRKIALTMVAGFLLSLLPLAARAQSGYDRVASLNRLKALSARYIGKTVELRLDYNGVTTGADGQNNSG